MFLRLFYIPLNSFYYIIRVQSKWFTHYWVWNFVTIKYTPKVYNFIHAHNHLSGYSTSKFEKPWIVMKFGRTWRGYVGFPVRKNIVFSRLTLAMTSCSPPVLRITLSGHDWPGWWRRNPRGLRIYEGGLKSFRPQHEDGSTRQWKLVNVVVHLLTVTH